MLTSYTYICSVCEFFYILLYINSNTESTLLELYETSHTFYIWNIPNSLSLVKIYIYMCIYIYVCVYIYIYIYIWRHSWWCNEDCYKRWTQQRKFKSWTRLFEFHIVLVPLGKVSIPLFSLQLWVNSRKDSLTLVWQPGWEKENSEFTSVKLHLKK